MTWEKIQVPFACSSFLQELLLTLSILAYACTNRAERESYE